MLHHQLKGQNSCIQACPAGDYKDRNEVSHKMFAARGYAVFTFDVHGHGESEPLEDKERAAILKFSHLVDDAEQFLEEAVHPWVAKQSNNGSRVPVVVHGTSMGGLVVRALPLRIELHTIKELHACCTLTCTVHKLNI
jgi:alpha-beta hydrolase superfamily lysophospholipase